ncbi:hypothetical protein [Pseudomonas putida]|uniref:Uncharacterized protein n=1 Tax=Pseudomonas putida TaxID=303 RepID=A0A8I1EG24_PSEPU|nr:hypothetical protein [Pseudomonas putida]MBI6885095.1 hypothetical protein [Pseudomonas putida]
MNRTELTQQFFDNLMAAKSTKIKHLHFEIYPRYRLLRINGRSAGRPDDFEIAFVDTVAKEIGYYLHVTKLDGDLGGKPLIHALPYRSTNWMHQFSMRGLPATILYDYLLPDFTAILSDGNPYAGGLFLWESTVSQTIAFGRKAYYIEESGTLRAIESREAHLDLHDELWSAPARGRINLAAISKKNLTLDANLPHLLEQLKPRMHIDTSKLVLGNGILNC